MVLCLVLLLAQISASIDASKLALTAPATVAVVDIDKIKGEPWRLAWSPDGRQMHLAAMKRQRNGTLELTHHLIDVTSGEWRKVDAAPEWSTAYWDWKAAKSAPGQTTFGIELDTQKKNQTATARPMGGALARGGVDAGSTGATLDDAAGQGSTNILVITMLVKGEIVGRWEGEPMVPGLTFGWGPKGLQAIAFAAQDGGLMVLDEQGRSQKIKGTRDVRLPAWSDDGSRLAWVEKQDRKKFRIQVAGVSAS